MAEAKIIRSGKTTTVAFTPPASLASLTDDLTMPCGGQGYCGKCRVRAKGALSKPTAVEKKKLHADRLAKGMRLACQALALGDVTITLPDAEDSRKTAAGDLAVGKAMGTKYGFAIDLGTTGLCVMLYDLANGKQLCAKTAANPQSRYGADVLSRIKHAMVGDAAALQTAIRNALFDLCAEAHLSPRLAPNDGDAAVLTGNTAMLYLLYGVDPTELSASPFDCKTRFGDLYNASFLPMRKGSKVYVPPCISAFLGADTVCAALGSDLLKDGVRLLADLGTNGEMLLRQGESFVGCSCAAGPAFEAVGLACGMAAVTGAICEVRLSGGHLLCQTVGNETPKGLCGSGVLDLLACMLRRGDLQNDGTLKAGLRMYIEDTPTYITQQDVRAFQLAKSAVRTGLETLLETAGSTSADSLELAGSFGTALNPRSAARTGLIPPALQNVTTGVGNAAAKGAAMLLLSRDLVRTAQRIAAQTQTLSLAAQPDFNDRLCRYTTLG